VSQDELIDLLVGYVMALVSSVSPSSVLSSQNTKISLRACRSSGSGHGGYATGFSGLASWDVALLLVLLSRTGSFAERIEALKKHVLKNNDNLMCQALTINLRRFRENPYAGLPA